MAVSHPPLACGDVASCCGQKLSPNHPGYPQKTTSYPQGSAVGNVLWSSCPPYLGDAETQGTGIGGVDIGRGVVESEMNRLLAVLVEPLAQSDDLAPEIRVFLDQIGDTLAAVEDGGVVTPSQYCPNLGQ